LNPGANLTAGTQYTATLIGGPAAIRDAAGNALSPNPLTWTFTTAGSGDTVAPTVTARTPAVDAPRVGRASNITATFSEPVQGVSGTTFTLTDVVTGEVIPATVTRNGTTNKWILNPGASLAARTRFTVTITGGANGVRDLAGNPLAGDVTWSFTTGT
jgi:hypothetical protein